MQCSEVVKIHLFAENNSIFPVLIRSSVAPAYACVMNGNERQKRNVELSIATCKLTEPGRLE